MRPSPTRSSSRFLLIVLTAVPMVATSAGRGSANAAAGPSAAAAAQASPADPLRFPKDTFTVETRTVKTSRDDLQTVVNLMNPMYFIGLNNKGMAGHGADQDAEDFIVWIAKTTGFKGRTTSSSPSGAWASWMM
jgi:hypothetical protein